MISLGIKAWEMMTNDVCVSSFVLTAFVAKSRAIEGAAAADRQPAINSAT